MSDTIISHKPSEFYPIEFGNAVVENVNQRVYKNYSLCYISDGRIKYTVNKDEYILKSNDLFVIFPETLVSLENLRDGVFIRIECGGPRTGELLARADITPENPVLVKAAASVGEQFSEFADVPGFTNAAADIAAQARLYELISVIVDSVKKGSVSNIEKDKQIAQAMSYINENYMNVDLSVIDVSAHVDLNPNYFSRKFKEQTGKSFSKYLIEVRLKHACTLIAEGVHSLKKVSELTGYSNQLYFSKEFKKEVGCAPKEYRARFEK